MSILLENISKYYGTQPILSQLSLEVEAGELFVLLGASGSGKSTLLRVIAGLTTLDSGRVILHDRDVTELPPQQRAIGFVFQNYSLFRHMTVADNIAFALDVQQVARPERDRRVTELLSLIDLSDCADRLPAQLSGGQQQRVALARALAHQPAVLLLDEPFGALDTKIRIQLRQNLRTVQQRLGVTTILVTHDQDEAFELADRIGIIEQGRLLEIGTSGDLYHAPRYRYTARFLGTTNMLPGHWHDGKLIVGTAQLTAKTDQAADSVTGSTEIMVRPEAIHLSVEVPPVEVPSGAADIHWFGSGIVQEITFAGALQRVRIEADQPDMPPITALLSDTALLHNTVKTGQRVWIGFDRFHVIP